MILNDSIFFIAILDFTIYNGFTTVVKGGFLMKVTTTLYPKEYHQLFTTLTIIPIIERCDFIRDKKNGFIASLIFIDSSTEYLDVTVLNRAFPSIIANFANRQRDREHNQKNTYPVIMAPYISNESAKQCEIFNMGYMDLSGNCRILVHSLFISDQGHPNKFAMKRKAKTIFDPSSKVSSLILREIMSDTTQSWKLSLISEKLLCSIGQVSKVKDYLCEQLWARMTSDGLRIIAPQLIMQAWSEAYSKKAALFELLDFYTLLSISEFEERVRKIKTECGVECFLSGFSGGARYTPVVRYNKVHLLLRDRDVQSFLETAVCKPVDTGANIQILVLSSDELLHDSREINEALVVSPVQAYLDCMRLKGRGEEMAEAILAKEIIK